MNNLQLGKVAGSAVIIENKKILLLKRNADKSLFPGFWTFASGGVEETDLSIQDTVVREVKEETNLDYIVNKKFGFYESTANGKRHFALVHLGSWVGNIVLQRKELSECGFFTYEEAIKLPLAFAYGEVINDLHAAGLIQ